AEDGIRDIGVTGVQTCALPIWRHLMSFDEQVDDYLRCSCTPSFASLFRPYGARVIKWYWFYRYEIPNGILIVKGVIIYASKLIGCYTSISLGKYPKLSWPR